MPRVVVVGAGFGGIAAAAALKRAGHDDLLILDAADGVGGVWRDNTYPGCACDIPATLYSFSFAPNPDWSRRYPPQREILAYLEACADTLDLRRHLRLRTRLSSATWDERDVRWHLETADGGRLAADVLVTAVGQLSRPHVPHLPGAERFTGVAFHSARWRHDVPLDGRRVAVVGTGASAMQFVPRIARSAAAVTVFQRSAPWTLPKPDRRYGRLTRALARHVPWTVAVRRRAAGAVTGLVGLAVLGHRLPRWALAGLSRARQRLRVRDPGLRRRLRPDHPLGCKRVVFSADWLPAVAGGDVTLVDEPITDVGPGGLRTADGREYPCEVLVYATGFAAADLLAPMRITGRDGRELRDVWRDGARAHLGLAVPGFPNLFMLYGPNTNTGHAPVIVLEEAQARHVAQAVSLLATRTATTGRPATLEVRASVERRYDDELQRRLALSVWTACTNWYRTPSGRVVTNWPGTAREYRRRTGRLRAEDYLVDGL